ncbi:hypothetical protein AALO_G00027110 [Alosa alosa]|uniref:Uncharacterized protein n=1 Tax=Alosa alosa TaxID=278164 RepID=A0AAV6HB85_9TELE|nr:hypothetical protein AALO_G00027110 [Alosa alosa]
MEDRRLHQVDFQQRRSNEHYVSNMHIKIDDIHFRNNYLDKCVEPNDNGTYQVPQYPRPVEFHVPRISHVTASQGLQDILKYGGFIGGWRSSFLRWGLVIGPEEILNAEQRYLETLFPDRSPEEKERQEPFLRKFTTSPEFGDASRYGNFRFTFSLADVLQMYSTQFCREQRPVLRVYETVIFRQLVRYIVLIHSPDVHDYDAYPELGDNDEGVCTYRDGEIIWHAQAISGTHRFRLIENREERQVHVDEVDDEFYVWDHVTLAFHMPRGKILRFPRENLKGVLSTCPNGDTDLNKLIGKQAADKILSEIL